MDMSDSRTAEKITLASLNDENFGILSEYVL